MPNFII